MPIFKVMKLSRLLLVWSCLFAFSVNAQQLNENFTLVLHGGAGNISSESMSPEREAACQQAMEAALQEGYIILEAGGTALDAIEVTIRTLEDSPWFNAGKGAVFASDGTNQLDASIMDGQNLNAGGVTGTQRVKNPITAARAVLDHSPHVLLSGQGADDFAKQQGLDIVNQEYFYEESRFRKYEQAKERDVLEKRLRENMRTTPEAEDSGSLEYELLEGDKFGTVGAVALDRHGNMAAGTSTGGMNYKRYGRIGDSPLIGAGTYANNETCAVSCTGHGEYFMRTLVAYDVSARIEYEGADCEEAVQEIIYGKLKNMGGRGGLIAINDEGDVIWEFNTPGMFRGSVTESGWMEIGMYGLGTEKPVKAE